MISLIKIKQCTNALRETCT